MATDDKTLEQALEDMLDVESFDPPDEFRQQANVSDASIYESADADFEGFWAEQARALDWATEPTQVLDWSDPPFAKWFADGKLNVSHNCVDRHVEAGNGDRVAFHWRGGGGGGRDRTYAHPPPEGPQAAKAPQDP